MKEIKKIKISANVLAIILAIIAANIVNYCPQDVKTLIVGDVVSPFLSKLLKLIIAVIIPTIFVSIVSSICMMKNTSMFSSIGIRIIKRFLVLTAFIIFIAMIVCIIFFPVVSFNFEGSAMLVELFQLFFAVIPRSLFSPFIDGNILQVVMISLLTGIVIITTRDWREGYYFPKIQIIIAYTNNFFFKLSKIVFTLIPLIIFLSIFKALTGTYDSHLSSFLKIIAAHYISFIIIIMVLFIRLKFLYGIDLINFLKNLQSTLSVSFFTASGSVAMIPFISDSKEKLKIDPTLCDFWIPLSYSIFSPTNLVPLTVCSFVGAEYGNIELSIDYLLIAAIYIFQFSIITPKVNGGMTSSYTLLLSQLVLSNDAIGLMLAAGIFISNFKCVFGTIVRFCEIYDLSHKIKIST